MTHDPQHPVQSSVSPKWRQRILVLSLLLVFFAIPHTLEDFAGGEPAKAGVPAPALALVISTLVALQALGLYWLGRGQRRGSAVHVVVGAFWPIAAGMAQLPVILTMAPYRSGAISIAYVAGMIIAGALLCICAVLSLLNRRT